MRGPSRPSPALRRLLPGLGAALLLLAGCESPIEAAPGDVEGFVREAKLTPLHGYDVLLAVPTRDLFVFSISFGGNHDCPSGCITSGAIGLRHAGKIGWLKVDNFDAPGDTLRLRYYDFDAADTALFSTPVLELLATPEAYRQPGMSWYVLGPAVHRMVRDPDTPEPTLVELARRLPAWRVGYDWALLEAARVRGSRTVLETVLALPPGMWDHYGEVRRKAGELLSALES